MSTLAIKSARWLRVALVAIAAAATLISATLGAAIAGDAPQWTTGDEQAAVDSSAWPVPSDSELQTTTDLYDRIAAQQASTGTAFQLLPIGLSVIFKAAAFLLIALGLSRSKKNIRIWAMHLTIPVIAILAFWVYGFALGFGNWFNGPAPPGWYATLGPGLSVLDRGVGLRPGVDDNGIPNGTYKYGLLGTKGFCLHGVDDPSVTTLFLFMAVFLVTAAILPIGAMTERWSFKSFLIYGLWFALPYSIMANWLWAGGWLAQAGLNWGLGHGVVDFSGSAVVDGMAGLVALAGCIVLGPRIGFDAAEELRSPSGTKLAAVVIGTALLLLPLVAVQDSETLPVWASTVSSTLAGALSAGVTCKVCRMPLNLATICKGLLTGLAAIEGPCPFVTAPSAAVIGAVAGMLCVLSLIFWRRLGVDDVVGATSVFGAGGIWGFVAVGLFANGRVGNGWNGVLRADFAEVYGTDGVRGLFYGDPSQFVAQLLGAGVLVVFGFAMAFAWFKLTNLIVAMRLSPEAEMKASPPNEAGAAGGSTSP